MDNVVYLVSGGDWADRDDDSDDGDVTPDEAYLGRVLVVDDEVLLLRSYKRVLSRAGFAVELASGGEQAVDAVMHSNFDAVITDIRMPGTSGLDLLRIVRKVARDLPVILITGGPNLETAVQAVELDAFKYLIKPIDMRELCDTVRDAVEYHRLARETRVALENYSDTDTQQSQQSSKLEERFDRALDSLWIAFQPIVSWNRKELFGFEALVRTEEPSLEMPLMLFEAADKLGRIKDVGRRVRARVAEVLPKMPITAKVFVNVHPHELSDEELYSREAPLAAAAHQVVLEITERASLDSIADLEKRLEDIRAIGYELAIDDLGAGYAGLSAFARVHPEVAKIDMSLVRDIHKDETKVRLVKAMVRVCADLNIQVIIEGVERLEERDTLSALGCDLMQGFFFGRPARDLKLEFDD